MQIRSKKQMYALLRAGALGNPPHMWRSRWVAYQWGIQRKGRLLGIRSLRTSDPIFVSGLSPAKFLTHPAHRTETPLVFSESTDNDQLLIQGEVSRLPGGLHFEYSTQQLPMRQALAERRSRASGLAALTLLRQHLDVASFECLMGLLDVYPDHVVEISTFERGVGRWGWNTIFWEVRAY